MINLGLKLVNRMDVIVMYYMNEIIFLYATTFFLTEKSYVKIEKSLFYISRFDET